MFDYMFLGIFSYLLFPVILFALPITLVVISSIKKGNPDKKPFLNQDDFFRQILSLTGMYFWSLFFWGVFYSLVNNSSLSFTETNVQWGIFLNVLSLGVFAYYQRTYMGISLWVALVVNYIFGQMLYWIANPYYNQIASSDSSNSIEPTKFAYPIFAYWLLFVLTYIAGQYLTLHKKWYRLGTALRIFGILNTYIFLLIFSLSIISENVWGIFTGSEFQTLPVYLLTIVIAISTIAAVTYTIIKDSLKFEKWEPIVLAIAPLLLLLATPLINTQNAQSPSELADFMWFSGFTVLLILYNFYLFIRSQISGEIWLKVLAIVLLVNTMLFKLFDNFGGLTQKGFFFIVMGGFFFGLLIVRNKFVNKELKLNQ